MVMQNLGGGGSGCATRPLSMDGGVEEQRRTYLVLAHLFVKLP